MVGDHPPPFSFLFFSFLDKKGAKGEAFGLYAHYNPLFLVPGEYIKYPPWSQHCKSHNNKMKMKSPMLKMTIDLAAIASFFGSSAEEVRSRFNWRRV